MKIEIYTTRAKTMKKAILFIVAFLTFSSELSARSPFRKKDKDVPQITIGWKHSKKIIVLARDHIPTILGNDVGA